MVLGVRVVDECPVLAQRREDLLGTLRPVHVDDLRLPGSTAVANETSPKTRTSPVRTFPTAVTPGACAAASAASIGMGEKLFCAVIA